MKETFHENSETLLDANFKSSIVSLKFCKIFPNYSQKFVEIPSRCFLKNRQKKIQIENFYNENEKRLPSPKLRKGVMEKRWMEN